jgi:hypothetical protein
MLTVKKHFFKQLVKIRHLDQLHCTNCTINNDNWSTYWMSSITKHSNCSWSTNADSSNCIMVSHVRSSERKERKHYRSSQNIDQCLSTDLAWWNFSQYSGYLCSVFTPSSKIEQAKLKYSWTYWTYVRLCFGQLLSCWSNSLIMT